MQSLATQSSRTSRGHSRGGARTSRRGTGGGRAARFARNLRSRAFALAASPLLAILPLATLLLLTETSFVVAISPFNADDYLFFSDRPTEFVDSRIEVAEALRKQLQAVLYIVVFALAWVHRRSVLALVGAYPHLLAIIAWVLMGALYSADPVKVVTNTILLTVALLVAALHAVGSEHYDRLRPFYLSMLVPMALVHFGSLVLLMFYPVDIMAYVEGTQRYGGLAGNPNSLGGSAVMGMWAATALLADPTTPKRLRTLAMLCIGMFLISIVLSGSGTSTVVAMLVVAALLYLRGVARLAVKWRPLLNLGAVGAVVVAVLGVFVFSSPSELLELSAGSLGKDATLTGRTELWDIALHAISVHPIVGHSLDSHFSVMQDARFEIPHNHYHNGFLDTWVAGGVVLIVLVLYNLGRFVIEFLRAFGEDPRVFPLAAGFLILVLLNLSEYSLLRPLSQPWQAYLVAFVACVWPTVMRKRQRSRKRRAARTARSGGKPSGRALSW